MKTLRSLFALALVAWATTTYAQCDGYWLGFTQGRVVEYASLSAKNTVLGRTRNEIKSVTSAGSSLTALCQSTSLDKDGKEQGTADFQVQCADGTVRIQLRNMAGPGLPATGGFEMRGDIRFIEYPRDMAPGQTLPEGTTNFEMFSSGNRMGTLALRVFNRKVEAAESVTTPAGTFQCLKLSFDTEVKMQIGPVPVNTMSRTLVWVAKGVGDVKMEFYDEKGRLNGSQVLQSLK